MKTPYSELAPTQYWRRGVAEVHPTRMDGLYRKKFDIDFFDQIVTAGSCFAQHVAASMRRNGYTMLDVEELPGWVPPGVAREYGYGIYSARYGNIYTSRQLLQLMQHAESGLVDPRHVWEKGGRYYDALRPSVEPDGLDSVDEVLAHRSQHLARVAGMFASLDVFVFTLGLTETWQFLSDGTVYPTCPGVVAGKFDASVYGFLNLGFVDVHRDMVEVRDRLMALNPEARIILTVSPVPLTATASAEHVLVATQRSKSILRAVCATLADEFTNVDYFPSYEIITSPGARSMFYEPNLRSISPIGVETVMNVFFDQHPPRVGETIVAPAAGEKAKSSVRPTVSKADIVCEEALLEAFGI